MSGKPYKFLLGAIAAVLLVGASALEQQLNHERDVLGLTRYTELKGAPPVLALTTVALGGFRGLISNALWIRANDLQDQDKYFEMVQLADWITKLEPHFSAVWIHQAWNMAYNISVKFKDPEDRWRWVQRGIELLRDEGLKYNPHDVLMHRELAWFFQHKMGANMDDAQMFYKQSWAHEMNQVFGAEKQPNWEALLDPKTDDEKQRATLLREKFKMDPAFMKQVDDTYGPLEWRLPEAHAIYWAARGLEEAKLNERRIDPDDLITLRRVIYQSMQLSFQRGRMIKVMKGGFELGPNLAIIPKVSAAYEQAMKEDQKNRDHIQTAHRNFLRDAVYLLYTYNRMADASRWFKYLCDTYPDKPLMLNVPTSLPGHVTLDDYALARLQEEVGDMNQYKTKAVLEGLVRRAFICLSIDEDEQYLGLDGLAQKVYTRYESKTAEITNRVPIEALSVIRREVLDNLLTNELPDELAGHLRSVLGLPAPTNTPPAELPPGTEAAVPARP